MDDRNLDIDEVLNWMKDANGEDNHGNVIWKSEDSSWAQKLQKWLNPVVPPEPALKRSSKICAWRGENEQGDRFVCNNEVLWSAVKKGPLKYCGWHMPTCVCYHHPGRTPLIGVPNEGALCLSHYVTKHKTRPPDIELLDCPGVVLKVRYGTRQMAC